MFLKFSYTAIMFLQLHCIINVIITIKDITFKSEAVMFLKHCVVLDEALNMHVQYKGYGVAYYPLTAL